MEDYDASYNATSADLADPVQESGGGVIDVRHKQTKRSDATRRRLLKEIDFKCGTQVIVSCTVVGNNLPGKRSLMR